MYPVQPPDAVFDFRQFLREYVSPLPKVRRNFGGNWRRAECAYGFAKRPLAFGVKLQFVAIRGDNRRLSLFQFGSQLLHQRQSLLERTKRETGLGIHDSKPGAITPCHPIDAAESRSLRWARFSRVGAFRAGGAHACRIRAVSVRPKSAKFPRPAPVDH